jgi:hypothetical protein
MIALAGAAATISSDALMNPFDGESGYTAPYRVAGGLSDASDQATDADQELALPQRHTMC